MNSKYRVSPALIWMGAVDRAPSQARSSAQTKGLLREQSLSAHAPEASKVTQSSLLPKSFGSPVGKFSYQNESLRAGALSSFFSHTK